MHAFYFGTSNKSLFGVYHPPATSGGASGGIVVCQPLGHEYIRAHRALRNLALRLSTAGMHVLRFDYYGCGDSSGASEDGTPAQWQADVGTAIDELKDMAELKRVSVIGVRFGATLAALATAGRRDIETLVLWDPVLRGADYVGELMHVQERWLESRPRVTLPPGFVEEPELIGFPLRSEARRQFEAIDLETIERWPAKKIAVVLSQDGHGADLCDRLAQRQVQFATKRIACDCRWQRPEAVHLAVLANEMIHGVAELFENKVPA